MAIKFGSVCSGIEAASLAFEPLGWQPSWFAEIDKFPAAVLAHRWPHVPNHGDMTTLPEKILSGEVDAPDVLVGGTPCQAFSVAGLRGGLDDNRGNLTMIFVRIFDAINTIRRQRGESPALFIWENVPGVFSSKDNAFGCFLGALAGESLPLKPAGGRWTNAGCVFGANKTEIAWRTLDSQFFGLAQQRKRVFVVGSAGDWRSPSKILFERQGKTRDFKSCKKSQENITTFAQSSFGGYKQSPIGATLTANGGMGYGGAETLVLEKIAFSEGGFGTYKQTNIAGTLRASGGSLQGGSETVVMETIVVNGRQDPCISDKAFSLDCQPSGNTNVICVNSNIINKTDKSGGVGLGVIYNKSYTLTCNNTHAVVNPQSMRIRRFTPIECERLQGIPDKHTQIQWRDKQANDCPDGHRYKAIGNSMSVPVMRWIAQRIKKNED